MIVPFTKKYSKKIIETIILSFLKLCIIIKSIIYEQSALGVENRRAIRIGSRCIRKRLVRACKAHQTDFGRGFSWRQRKLQSRIQR